MSDNTVSEARKREFWENLAAKPVKYSEYELTDEHIRSLQSSRDLPEATPMRRAHFDAWLVEHDRRVLAETQKRIDDAIAYLSQRSFSNGVVPKALALLRGDDA